MFVLVRYFKPELAGYAGKDYTYRTELPLRTGDKVVAPTVKEPRNRGIVTKVDVAEPPFACREIAELEESESV